MVAEATYEYTATPRQDEVRRIIGNAPDGSTIIIGYGGSAGGAKTNLLANTPLDIALDCPGSNLLVVRQNFADLMTTTMAEFDRSCPPGVVVRRNDSSPAFRDIRSETGATSRVWFRHLGHDWQSILSNEYDGIFIDEAQETALIAVLGLMTRLRGRAVTKWPLVVGFNPFPSWPVDWFMKQKFDEETRALFTKAKVEIHFVPSRIRDNPHLREGYEDMLKATLAKDPYMKAIMVDGDPDAALGGLLYFDRQILEAGSLLTSPPLERYETRPTPEADADGEVLIWEMPMIGERYYAGADTADGLGEELALLPEKGGSDRNAAAIYKADGQQVAAIYGRQEEHSYARVLDKWGRAYNNALLCVERNRRAVLSNLRGLGYPNLYFTERTTDMHLVMPVNPVRQIEYGFNTDTKTRPTLLSDFREALTMRVMKPRDQGFYDEAENFIAGPKPQARQGTHDDRVFAHALANQARKAMRSGSVAQSRGAPRLVAGRMRM